MTTFAQSFGAHGTLTVDAATWAQGVTVSTTALDVSALSPVPIDIELTISSAIGAGALGASKAINVWVAISEDGTNYSDNDQYSGTANTQSALRSPSNFLGPFVIAVNTVSITQVAVIPSLRTICGDILPRKFGLVLENQTNATQGTPAVGYTPVNFTNS